MKTSGSKGAACVWQVGPFASRPARGCASPKTCATPVASDAPPAPSKSSSAAPLSPTYVSREARATLFGQAQQQEEVEATVTGSLPAWLNGSLVLNGPGQTSGMLHMFDGYAMLCKLRVSQGRVYGSQKYIDTKAHSYFRRTGVLGCAEFATPVAGPTPPLLRLLATLAHVLSGAPAVTDNGSVNVLPLPRGELLALSESLSSQYRVDTASLDTMQQVAYDDGLPGVMTTAHPKFLADGTLVNFMRTLPFGGFHVFKQDPHTLRRTEIAFIKDRDPLNPAWVHDMALSSNHLIIVENPLYLQLLKLAVTCPEESMQWRPEDGSRVHVVPLDGSGDVQTFDAPTFFTLHLANAFEEDGRLHVDFACYEDATVVKDLYLAPLRAFPGRDISSSAMRRITVPLSRGAAGSDKRTLDAPQPLVRDEAIHGQLAEFPVINPSKGGLRHRYVWMSSAVRPTNFSNALAKLDVQTGEVATWHEGGSAPSAPVFVAAPSAGAAEDEGVLLSTVASRTGGSYLLVLDAANMTELARADLSFGVPYRFHGGFLKGQL